MALKKRSLKIEINLLDFNTMLFVLKFNEEFFSAKSSVFFLFKGKDKIAHISSNSLNFRKT